MAYVTDTTAGADADYVDRIRGVDVLCHECNFRDGQNEWAVKTGHSSTSLVVELAKLAGVGRLVLIHLDPLDDATDPVGIEQARQIFPRTDVGCDRMEIDF
jgi:ribonuclease Z